MNRKTRVGCVLGFLQVLIVQPIWYYLLYQILSRVGATHLMWFLYFVYVPVGLTLSILFKYTEAVFDDEDPPAKS